MLLKPISRIRWIFLNLKLCGLITLHTSLHLNLPYILYQGTCASLNYQLNWLVKLIWPKKCFKCSKPVLRRLLLLLTFLISWIRDVKLTNKKPLAHRIIFFESKRWKQNIYCQLYMNVYRLFITKRFIW